MGIIDEVEHKKIPKVDTRKTKELGSQELEARDFIFKAGTLMRSPLTKLQGAAAIFFYEGSSEFYEFKTFTSVDHVNEGLARTGVKEFNIAMMKAYGIPEPKERR